MPVMTPSSIIPAARHAERRHQGADDSQAPLPCQLPRNVSDSDDPAAAEPVPASLMTLLAVFAPLFTAPSFRTFTALACGFLAQPGKRTVCGMLTGAGLSRLWPHDRAHSFFSRARWNPEDLGIAAAGWWSRCWCRAGSPWRCSSMTPCSEGGKG
jgi:hypothetical protein